MLISDWSSDVCSSDLIEIEHDFNENLTLRNATRYGETLNDYLVTNPGDGTVKFDSASNQYWLQRGTKSRWQEGTMLANVTELYGSLDTGRSEEHTSELQSLMRISYAVFCLTKKKIQMPRKYKKLRRYNDY